MINRDRDKMTEELVNKWKGLIGHKWEPPSSIEEVLSREIICVDGWNEHVGRQAIRNWAIMSRDFNALWVDEDYAGKTRWGSIIAPPTFLFSVREGAQHGIIIYEEARTMGIPFSRMLNGGYEWEFYEPVRPGDNITATTVLAEIHEKREATTTSIIVIDETTYTNQNGQQIADNRGTTILTRE